MAASLQARYGLTLSQKYRIALARAIIRDPALLIIEEPEEQMDDETKDLLDDALARFLPGRTVIFLPHRLTTIRSCDCIFLFRDGQVVAAGPHRDLLNESELYRHLQYLEFNVFAEHFAAQRVSPVDPSFVWYEGLPLLDGALAHLACQVVDVHAAGDHELWIGEVQHVQEHDGEPLLFYSGRFGKVQPMDP